jgi:sporulation protein YlmC with PRC-barrel domain
MPRADQMPRGPRAVVRSLSVATAVLIAGAVHAPAAKAQATPSPPAVEAPAVLNYLVRQAETQRLATGILGKNVYGVDGQRIGDINDVVLDTQTGAVPAIVIGVGGFLGLGEKDVAVPLSTLRIENRDGRPHFALAVSREDLRKAPAFVRTHPGL